MASSFLKALAQARPDPGGGAAAAHAAALGVALLEKVVRLERQRQGPKNPSDFPWDELLGRAQAVGSALLRLQDEDVAAYGQLARARATGTPAALVAALEEVLACPMRIMQKTQEGLCLIYRSATRCKFHLVADLLVACELLGAALRGAHHIARANLPLMRQEARRAIWAANLDHTFSAVESEFQQVRSELLERKP